MRQATLFDAGETAVGGDRETVETGDRPCKSFQAAIEQKLCYAHQRGAWHPPGIIERVTDAEDAGCISTADAEGLESLIAGYAPEPTEEQFRRTMRRVAEAF